MLASLAMALSSVSVVSSSLRLRGFRGGARAGAVLRLAPLLRVPIPARDPTRRYEPMRKHSSCSRRSLLAAGCAAPGGKGSEVRVTVTDNGFEPEFVTVEKGRPATLVITRKVEATCATEAVFAATGKKYPLPLNQDVRIPIETAHGRDAALRVRHGHVSRRRRGEVGARDARGQAARLRRRHDGRLRGLVRSARGSVSWAAFFVSIVGTALGVYAANRLTRHWGG